MSEIILTKRNFRKEVIRSDMPVLVDFKADWCVPCTILAPVVKKLAEDFEDIIKVGKVDVDKEPQLAKRYDVSNIPTLMLFENGKMIKKTVGLHSKEELIFIFQLKERQALQHYAESFA